MYLDPRLWAFTRGVRLRIAWTVLVGLVAVGVGISRLVLFGWLLGARHRGRTPARPRAAQPRSPPPPSCCGARSISTGPWSPTTTAARVQSRCGRRSTITSPRSAPPTSRGRARATSSCRWSRASSSSRSTSASTSLSSSSRRSRPPHLRLRGVRGCADLARLPRRRPRHARRARRLASDGPGAEHGALAGLCRLRRGVLDSAPGARHAQGVRAERAAGGMLAGQGQDALREHHGRAGDQHAGPGHHRYGHRGGRGGPRLGRLSGARGGDGCSPRSSSCSCWASRSSARCASCARCCTRACSGSPRRRASSGSSTPSPGE